jgi:hypothetical protein
MAIEALGPEIDADMLEARRLRREAHEKEVVSYGFGKPNSLLVLVHPENDTPGRNIGEWQATLAERVHDDNYALIVVSGAPRTYDPKGLAYLETVEAWIERLQQEWVGRFFHYRGGLVPNDEEHRRLILEALCLPSKRLDFYMIEGDGISSGGCVSTQMLSFPCTSFFPPGLSWPRP